VHWVVTLKPRLIGADKVEHCGVGPAVFKGKVDAPPRSKGAAAMKRAVIIIRRCVCVGTAESPQEVVVR
jgi:hypothetical protein